MRFEPNWKLTLFALLFLPLLLALGTWQLWRADEKRRVEVELDAARQTEPRPLRADDLAAPANLEQVWISGRLDTHRLVYLDNRTHEGRAGYDLYARLDDAASDSAFLVGLGWVQAPARRDALPAVNVPATPITLYGEVRRRVPDPLVFGPAGEGASWPMRVQHLDLDALAQAFGRKSLYPWPIMANAGEPGVQTHVFEPVRMGSAVHLGYAAQWFALAAVLVVGWGVASFRRG